jgi:DNA-binding transcriptional ArsR family regulator
MKADSPLFQQVARIGHAIGSASRLALLDLLRQSPRTVEALAREAGLSLANTSQHLKVLRQARLVEAEKHGTFVTYRVADQDVDDFYAVLRALAEARLAEVQQIARASRPGRSPSSTSALRRSTAPPTSPGRCPFR